MQNDEPVIIFIVLLDEVDNLAPMERLNVRRIDRLGESDRVDFKVELTNLGDVGQEVVEIETFERPCLVILNHADSSTRIND